MVDLNGHEAGNGGYSQGTPTAHRPLSYSERCPVSVYQASGFPVRPRTWSNTGRARRASANPILLGRIGPVAGVVENVFAVPDVRIHSNDCSEGFVSRRLIFKRRGHEGEAIGDQVRGAVE